MPDHTPGLAEARSCYARAARISRPLLTWTEAEAEFDRLASLIWWNGYQVAEGDQAGVPVATMPGVRTNIQTIRALDGEEALP